MNENIRSRLGALVVLIVMGIAAFAAYPPGVAAADANEESVDAARHEPVAEPDVPSDTKDHPRSCNTERDEWSFSPLYQLEGQTQCPQPIPLPAPSDWDCCGDDESQQKAEESSDTDERGDSSSDMDEGGDSSSDTDERNDSSSDVDERGESSSDADERGDRSSDADGRGESQPAMEDDGADASDANVDLSEPIPAPVDSVDLDGDDDVPLVDDDLIDDVLTENDGHSDIDLGGDDDAPSSGGVPPTSGVSPTDGFSPNEGAPPSDGISPTQPDKGPTSPGGPPAVIPPLEEPTLSPVDQGQASGAGLPLLKAPQNTLCPEGSIATLSLVRGPSAVTEEGPNLQPSGPGSAPLPNPIGRETAAKTPAPQGPSGDGLPSAKPTDGDGLFAPLSEPAKLALPAGLGVVLMALLLRKPHEWYDSLRRVNLGVRRAMLGELADDLSDGKSEGYHEVAAPFAGINAGTGGEQNLVVLAVDGDAASLSLVERELTAEGMAVVPASSGSQALLQFGQSRPDIVLLAETMPDFDGVAAMQTLKSTGVPVILLMNANDPAERVRVLELGADDCIVKPFAIPELAARIRAVLRRVNREYRHGRSFACMTSRSTSPNTQ